MTDEQMLRQMQIGNQEALSALMEKYRRYVYTIIVNIMGASGCAADAEELTQDAFYAVWNHSDQIRPGKLKSYLCVTARNGAKSFLRSRRTLPMDMDQLNLQDDAMSLEDQAIQEELNRKLKKAIHRMKPKDREIFLRYYYYMQTAEQIGRILDMPPSTVRSRLARGRKALKHTLSKEGYLENTNHGFTGQLL